MAQFEITCVVETDLERAFDFLTRPASVLELNPPEMGIRLVDAPDELSHGARVTFEITGYGPVQRVVHEIIAFDRPERFTESQVQGPLKAFVHEHVLEVGPNGIVVIDRIEFEPPGGMLGFLLTEARIRESLEGSFAHRHRALKQRLEQA